MSDDKVAIAFINKCWGVRGEVIAEPLTDFPQRFKKLGQVHISGIKIDLDLTVERIKEHGRKIIIKFREIDDRDKAYELRNSYLQVSKEEVYKLPAGNYYRFDLVGLEVTVSDNQVIGKIDDVLEYPAGDILVVRSEKGRLLVPMIKQVVKKVDVENGKLEVELLPGMEFEAE